MKKTLTGIVLAAALALSACSSSANSPDKNQLQRETLHGSYSINVENVNEIVGDADYVFVAKVNSEVETIYKNPVTIETESGTREVSDPYTKYSITVIDNLKGKLKKNTDFEILKNGGITEDKKSVVLYEDDNLLEIGKYHILAGYAQPDGSLLVSGPNSSILLPASNKEEVVSSHEYKKYKKAVENEVKTERKRFKSSHEE